MVTTAIWAEGISKITILARSAIAREYFLIDYTKNRTSNSGIFLIDLLVLNRA